VDGDEWLKSDAVFGVKASLITDYEKLENDSTQWRSKFNFILSEEK